MYYSDLVKPVTRKGPVLINSQEEKGRITKNFDLRKSVRVTFAFGGATRPPVYLYRVPLGVCGI